MAKEYDNSNSGIMYRNEEKDDEHPNWPDFKGSIEVTEPGEYWLSAWVKEGKNGKLEGKKFFSISFQPKEARGNRGSKSGGTKDDNPRGDSGGNKGSDDIPF